jgi:hypothetical protein
MILIYFWHNKILSIIFNFYLQQPVKTELMKRYAFIAFGLLNLILISCKDKSLSVPINPAVNAKVIYVDTFTVNLSTVLIDSLPTSNSLQLIAGSYNHNSKIGDISASAYFQLALNGSQDILTYTEAPVYDSIALELNAQYSYGDTNQIYTISVHEVKDIMQYSNGVALYNSSAFQYDPSALATKSFKIEDFPDHKVHIRLSDTFGSNLFNLANARDFRVTDNSSFMDYFRGLVIVPNSTGVIYGYSLNPVMRLYYHDSADPTTVKYYDFVYKNNYIHFNRITDNRSSTSLASLQNIYDEINSSQTSNEAYLLTGINLFPKIQIPYLNNIRKIYPRVFISKATLIITPEKNSYDQSYYPATLLSLFQTDLTNVPTNIINYSNTTHPQVISPYIDWETEENTNYTFDVTDFIALKLKDTLNTVGTGKALILGSNPLLSSGKAETLILAANSSNLQSIKFKLYFSVFK